MQRDHHLDQARQGAELDKAEAKALDDHYMQSTSMADAATEDWSRLAADMDRRCTMPLSIDLAKQGKCELCQGALQHGPWTDAQIAEVVAETGEPNFGDWCDDCFLREVGRGDVRFACEMAGRPLQLSSKAGFAALLKDPSL